MSGTSVQSLVPAARSSLPNCVDEAEDVSLLIATEGGGASEGGGANKGGVIRPDSSKGGGVTEGLSKILTGEGGVMKGSTEEERNTREAAAVEIDGSTGTEEEQEEEESSDEDDDLTPEQLLLLHSRHGNTDKVKHLLEKHSQGDPPLNINCKGKITNDIELKHVWTVSITVKNVPFIVMASWL